MNFKQLTDHIEITSPCCQSSMEIETRIDNSFHDRKMETTITPVFVCEICKRKYTTQITFIPFLENIILKFGFENKKGE